MMEERSDHCNLAESLGRFDGAVAPSRFNRPGAPVRQVVLTIEGDSVAIYPRVRICSVHPRSLSQRPAPPPRPLMHAPLTQPRSHTRTALILLLAVSAVSCGAPDPIDQITEAELRDDLFALAGDETRGREGGTLDELDASMWLADRAREAGLEPAGDNGTYFQYFPVERYRVSESSRVMLGGTDLALGSQVVPATTVLARVDAPVTVIAPEQIGADPGAAGRLGARVQGRVLVTRYTATEGAETSLLQFGRALLQMAGDAAEAIVVIVPTDQQDQWARNAPELVEMALQADTAVSGFVVDHSWDDPEHREGWYYRSDHLPYARTGVPALFFTTLLHDDYHTPFDNPDRIDIKKLHQMTRWMYQTGRYVAEADAAPALDPDFELERCRDYTGDYCN